MTWTVYQYPKCSTCRKAVKWLDAQGIAYTSVNLVETPPSASVLKKAIADSGRPLRAFFNTSGESYRAGGFKERLPDMTEKEAVTALAADGKLIKRPLLVNGTTVLVGFDEAEWARTVKAR
jgi:arsenate reductase (glutaredoxin)